MKYEFSIEFGMYTKEVVTSVCNRQELIKRFAEELLELAKEFIKLDRLGTSPIPPKRNRYQILRNTLEETSDVYAYAYYLGFTDVNKFLKYSYLDKTADFISRLKEYDPSIKDYKKEDYDPQGKKVSLERKPYTEELGIKIHNRWDLMNNLITKERCTAYVCTEMSNVLLSGIYDNNDFDTDIYELWENVGVRLWDYSGIIDAGDIDFYENH